MELAVPKLAVLDTATLGNASRDYWSQRQDARERARAFLNGLQERGIFVAFTITHLLELFGHDDHEIVDHRLRFLRKFPLIAWVRPYNGNWFPGSVIDVVRREIDVALQDSTLGWSEIVAKVRPDLWETGSGSDIFADNDRLWSVIEHYAKRRLSQNRQIASIARTDPGAMGKIKIRDAVKLPKRPKEDRQRFIEEFIKDLESQLARHGDRCLADPKQSAISFAEDVRKVIEGIEQRGGDPVNEILAAYDVPREFAKSGMSLEDVGRLAVFVAQLKVYARKMRPAIDLNISSISPDKIPSYVFEQKLVTIQRRAERVAGSDLGDGHLAPLSLYADYLEVDKRTYEFICQIRRRNPKLAELMGECSRSLDYARIPEAIG